MEKVDIEEQNIRCLKLIAAVLLQAVSDLCLPKNKRNEIFISSARTWVLSSDNHEYSFEWCCYFFDLSPEALRKNIYNKNILKDARKAVSKLKKPTILKAE